MKKIEVEFRALLTKESHGALMKTLEKQATDLGEDEELRAFIARAEKENYKRGLAEK